MKKALFKSTLVILSTAAVATVAYINSQEARLTKPTYQGEHMRKQHGITKSIEPNIGISAQDRSSSSAILNEVLATTYVLLVKTQNYHWNLVGPEFHDYHLLLDDQYKRLQEFADDIAERVRAVGGIALGSLQEFSQQSKIKDDSGDVPTPRQAIENLLADHEALIRLIREGINITGEHNRDMGTNNFFCEQIMKHEKMAWMLRSLLERK